MPAETNVKSSSWAVGSTVAMMVLDELYDSGTFRALNDQEKVTANLLMFVDKLPN